MISAKLLNLDAVTVVGVVVEYNLMMHWICVEQSTRYSSNS